VSVIHRERKRGKTYEVRQAGASIRLYTNGAFHSQWNPRHVFSGAVWDLLSLPTLFTATPPEKILMLGVGGGAGINQLGFLFPEAQVKGIEIDPVHLKLAKRFFSANRPRVSYVLTDAVTYIHDASQDYDIIIDDLYLDAAGDPEHPATRESEWTPTLIDRLNPSLALIKNHLDLPQANAWLRIWQSTLKRHFASGIRFRCEGYSNVITALYTHDIKSSSGLTSTLHDHLKRYPLTPQGRQNLRRIQIQRLAL